MKINNKFLLEKITMNELDLLIKVFMKNDYGMTFNQKNIGNNYFTLKHLIMGLIEETNKIRPTEIVCALKNKLNGQIYGLSFFRNINYACKYLYNDNYLLQEYRKGLNGNRQILFSMVYAFEKLNIEKIYYFINEDNKNTIGYMKKLNLAKREALLKKEIYKNGDYFDIGLYSLQIDKLETIKKKFSILLR